MSDDHADWHRRVLRLALINAKIVVTATRSDRFAQVSRKYIYIYTEYPILPRNCIVSITKTFSAGVSIKGESVSQPPAKPQYKTPL